jgi:hypothetical protein
MSAKLTPEGYAPLAEAAQNYKMTENAVRLLARRRKVRAVLIRGRIHVHMPDMEQLFQPQPYPPTKAA